MNISREKAEDVAQKLTEKLNNEATELANQCETLIQDFILKNTPSEVLAFIHAHPNWIGKTNVRVYGIDIYCVVRAFWTKGEITLDSETAKKYKQLHDKMDEKLNERRLLRGKIISAMLAMKTYARCKEQFPEAYELLPKTSVSTSLMVNLTDIRIELKNIAQLITRG